MVPELSIVIPVYRNAATLVALHERLTAILQARVNEGETGDYEILFVDDACPADSLAVLRHLAQGDPRVAVLVLEDNVGQNRAVLAGLAHVRGQVAVVLDADLQDPPEAIPCLLQALRVEVGAVFAGRRGAYESGFRLITSRLFKWALHRLSAGRLPKDAGLFVAMRREMIDHLIRCGDAAPYVVALMGRANLPLLSIPVRRLPNPAQASAYTTWTRFRLACTALQAARSAGAVEGASGSKAVPVREYLGARFRG